MRKIILFCLSIFIGITSFGQAFSDNSFQHFTLETKETGSFDIHVTKSIDGKQKPLIIYLDGSGNYPLFYRNKEGRTSTALAINFRNYSTEYTIAVISKPATAFYDSLQFDQSGRSYYPENELYKKMYSLDWRAATASETINYLLKNIPVDTSRIIVMGYSEGSQVAPRVAVINKHVTHVVCFSGNALNQLYDFILEARLSASRGDITADEGQAIVDSLYTVYEKIYSNPTSTSKTWYGATYLKWGSFSKTTPLENMLQLSIPILYTAGGKDNNQTILDMDYAKLEFLRKGKTNLFYKVYPNCDHYYQEEKTIDGKVQRNDRLDEVHKFALDWTKNN